MSTKYHNLRDGAAYVSEHHFEVSHRTLEAWPDLPRRIINKPRRVTEEELDEAALRRIAAANAKLTEATDA